SPSHVSPPAWRRTRPVRTISVASPGESCSPSACPAARATTVCRRSCSRPPKTVTAARPLLASRAAASCSSATLVSDSPCMAVPLQERRISPSSPLDGVPAASPERDHGDREDAEVLPLDVFLELAEQRLDGAVEQRVVRVE